jgi:adenylosuccinate synthase
MHIKVVIGSGYGDEGKGLVTDYLARKHTDSLVVRFNGGPQAAHTVHDEHIVHVFHSFGSGTLAGCPTYFTGDTLINPQMIVEEYEELVGMEYNPVIYLSPQAKVITPADILWNHYQEELRGQSRHGSCGMGINATVKRNHSLEITVKMIRDSLFNVLSARVIQYYNDLFDREEPSQIVDYYRSILNNPKLWQDYSVFIDEMFDIPDLGVCNFNSIMKNYGTLIFEGAQGLLLDESYGDMPHCTPSNTGIHNILSYLGLNFAEVF